MRIGSNEKEIEMFQGFEYDFTGVRPAGLFGVKFKTGYYKGSVIDIRDHDSDGDRKGCWVEFQTEQGLPHSKYFSYPLSKGTKTAEGKEDFAPSVWLSLLISGGFPQDSIKKVKIGAGVVAKLKEVFWYYEEPATPEDKYGNTTMVPKAAFEAGVASGAKGGVLEEGGGTGEELATPTAPTKAAPKKAAKVANGAAPPPTAKGDDLDSILSLE